MPDSARDSSAFIPYLVSPMSASPDSCCNCIHQTAPRYRLRQTLVFKPIWIDIFIALPHPHHLGIDSCTQNLEARLHSQASVLLLSISFTTNKHWILTPSFQYFPLSHLSQWVLGLMMQAEWVLYTDSLSNLEPHLLSSSTLSKNGALHWRLNGWSWDHIFLSFFFSSVLDRIYIISPMRKLIIATIYRTSRMYQELYTSYLIQFSR